MPIEETAELWCGLFGYPSCYSVPIEMAAVMVVTAALSIFAVIAVLYGLLQKLVG